jgi:hypothetical protein
MLLARLLDPQDIVEQQLLAIGRREARDRQSRAMDDHLPQFANL